MVLIDSPFLFSVISRFLYGPNIRLGFYSSCFIFPICHLRPHSIFLDVLQARLLLSVVLVSSVPPVLVLFFLGVVHMC